MYSNFALPIMENKSSKRSVFLENTSFSYEINSFNFYNMYNPNQKL